MLRSFGGWRNSKLTPLSNGLALEKHVYEIHSVPMLYVCLHTQSKARASYLFCIRIPIAKTAIGHVPRSI